MATSFRTAALNALLMFLYAELGRLALSTSSEYGLVTSMIFLPEGVALTFAILYGARIAPGILLGQALLSYWSGLSLAGGLAIGTLNACEGVLGGYLFHRWRLSPGFSRLRDVGWFAALVFLILQPISATGGILILQATGTIPARMTHLLDDTWWLRDLQKLLPASRFAVPAWLHWWIANALGQFLVTPLLLTWLMPLKRRKHAPLRWFELTALGAGVVIVLALIYSDLPSSPMLLMALGYALLVWIGLRLGIRAVTAANALLTVIVVWEGVHGSGFMSHLFMAERLFYASFFLATAALFSLILFALFEERRELIHELTELASVDALTQVSNRRHFMEQSELELGRARRQGQPISLAILDVDHFKTVNDLHGHAAGDQALQMLAHCCSETLRTGDLIGRVGGEEFAVLLPNTDMQHAGQTLRRLLDTVSRHTVHTPDGAEVHITFSAGVVEVAPEATLDEIYNAADQALYEAKHAGRNRVQLFLQDSSTTSRETQDA